MATPRATFRRARIIRFAFTLIASLAGASLPAAAAKLAPAETAALDEAAATLAQVERMLSQIGEAADLMRARAEAALGAAQGATDLDAADAQMRIYAELTTRAAEMEALGVDLRAQAAILRTRLEDDATR